MDNRKREHTINQRPSITFLPSKGLGNLRYIRSDYPGKLTEDEVKWLRKNDITTIVDLREEKEYKTRQCRLEKEDGFTYYHLPVSGAKHIT